MFIYLVQIIKQTLPRTSPKLCERFSARFPLNDVDQIIKVKNLYKYLAILCFQINF